MQSEGFLSEKITKKFKSSALGKLNRRRSKNGGGGVSPLRGGENF